MSVGIALRELGTDRRLLRDFIAAAHAAQGGDPNWVPELEYETRSNFSPAKNPFLRANDVAAWVAYRGAAPAGRIVAVVNHAHLARHRDATGQFGFFEAIDDDGVARALLDQAASWLAARGMRRMAGPFDASINHQAGLLVDGFASPPFIKTGHAPPRYARMLEAAGFAGVVEMHGHVCAVAASDFPERVAALRARWPGARDLVLRTARRFDGGRDAELVRTLYNEAWADNWGAVPVTRDEARYIDALTRPIARKDWTHIAEWRGAPIAMVVQIANLNEAIADLGGRLWPVGWTKLLWRLKIAGVATSRIPLIGLTPRWRGTRAGGMAVASLLGEAFLAARRARIRTVEISWMLAHNRAVLGLVESLPARRHKTWRIYARDL